MSKKDQLKMIIRQWLDHLTLGVSISLLTAGIVSAVMTGNENIIQNTVLIAISMLGIVLSFLTNILPHLLKKD